MVICNHVYVRHENKGGAAWKESRTSKRAMGVKRSKHMMCIILYYDFLPEIPLA